MTGRLAEAVEADDSLPQGWRMMQLEVPRRDLGGRREPGVIAVALVIPAELEELGRDQFRAGQLVAVVGMLDMERDYVGNTPRVRHAVIAESIELLG